MDEDWGSDSAEPVMDGGAGDDFHGGTSFSKGRGFSARNGSSSYDSGSTDRPFRGGRGGGGGRGGRGGSRGGYNNSDSNGNGYKNEGNFEDASSDRDFSSSSRGGRGRGGRGGRGGYNNDGGGDTNGNRGTPWTCPNTDCAHSNWAKRTQCQLCNEDKPASAGDDFGGRDNSNSTDWTCPNNDCSHNNWSRRTECQKCETPKPASAGGANEKPRDPNYIPPEAPVNVEEIFNTGIESGINFSKYDNISVQVTGADVPKPFETFQEAGLRKIVMENVSRSGYKIPTPIQKNSLPIIMSGTDLMACAQTGSGKTAAFLIPIINTLIANPEELVPNGSYAEPQAVIVSPTRELAIQIGEEARKFAYDSIIKTVVTYGGTNVRHQQGNIANGCHILVATPGRMNDFVNRSYISFASVRFVVLDEADRMLDMGFLPAIEDMMNHSTMPPTGERKTLMFSATFPEEIQRLAGRFLHNYAFVTIGIVGGACSDVDQSFHQVDKFSKRSKLLDILNTTGTDRTLIFVETKRTADFLASFLSENSIPTTSIHGDRLQREREQALRCFKQGTHNVLVATGVAARGLDIKQVKHVINFDLPKSIDEYVHRIGRTGRLGNAGKATSFFDEAQDAPIASELARILKQAGQDVPDWLGSGGYGNNYAGNSGFGGKDIRRNDYGKASAATAMDQPEEVWD